MLAEHLLHDYQREGVQFVCDHPEALLLLKMGLGKTVTSLTAFNRLKYEQFEVNTALVIAPKKVVESVWKQEAEQWEHLHHLKVVRVVGSPKARLAALRTRADVHVIGRDVLPWLCAQYDGDLPWDMLIVDELSSFKDHASKRFKHMQIVLGGFKRRIGLTGTPGDIEKLWSQVYMLDRGERLGKHITHFRRNFLQGTSGRASGGRHFTKYVATEAASEAVRHRIADITLSMGLEKLKMPEKVDIDVRLDLSDKLAKQYRQFKRDAYTEIVEASDTPGEITALSGAALSTKLRQFVNGHIYNADRNVLPVHTVKLEALEELIEAAQGEPVIVAYAFQHGRDALLKRLAKYGAEQLGGADSISRWNAGEIPVLVTHPGSGGHGLNLQKGGSTLIWFGMTWSLDEYEQLVARIYRQGQLGDTVRVYHLLVNGTIDVRMRDIIAKGITDQDSFLDALKAEFRDVTSK